MRAAEHPYFDAPTPIGLAHRGGAEYAPNRGIENTLAAFETAVAMGYRYLETDVHTTADGELIAFHDDRLDRVTDGAGLIAQLPYAAVREARVGGREPIPLLEQLLEELPDSRLNIDIKAPGAIEPLVSVIKRHNAFDRVCVGSFSQRRLAAARRLAGPGLATSAGQPGVASLRFLPRVLAMGVATPAAALQIPRTHDVRGREVTLVTPALVDRVHALGKHLHVWTIDDRAEMEELLDLGVDGIVTDRIDTLRDVLADRGAPLA
ncbi:glycerophosphodiester phosphodiesterase family protein [Actinomycetota bacterium]